MLETISGLNAGKTNDIRRLTPAANCFRHIRGWIDRRGKHGGYWEATNGVDDRFTLRLLSNRLPRDFVLFAAFVVD